MKKSPLYFCPLLLCAALAAFSWRNATAADASGFSVEKTAHGVTVKYNGELFTNYVIDDPGTNKPYLWPVIGPTGKPMTRAYPMDKNVAVEKELKNLDHPHHRSIWFGVQGINGYDTWEDQGSYANAKPGDKEKKEAKLGYTKHREFREVKADKNHAVISAVDDILSHDMKKMCEDEHTIVFRAEGDTRIIDYDIDYIGTEDTPAKFSDAKDAGFCVRVPSVMAVDSKLGGKIITSEGITDKAAWGTHANWCDYHGPIEKGGETFGFAMLDHPSSFRHPTLWHVRTYGLFTANPFGSHAIDKSQPDLTFDLKKGDRVKLRHRIIIHKGDEKDAHIAEAYEKYAAEKK